MKQEKVCYKHGITQEQLQDAVHTILNHVPADIIFEKGVLDAIFDLLRYGDIQNDKYDRMLSASFKAFRLACSQLKCELCLLNTFCNRVNKTRVDECCTSLMFFAQGFDNPKEEMKDEVFKQYASGYQEFIEWINKNPDFLNRGDTK